jgi:RNA polymerase sigma factor (sigma-70 family)
MDDAALVRQVIGGNKEAYGDLVLRWAGRITALCHARVGRPDLAEELAQETLVRGFEELPSLANPSRFGPWLAGIAVNTCRDWLTSRQNGQVHFSALPAGPLAESTEPGPLAQAERADETARLMRAVQTLPEDIRIVLLLFYYQRVSYREIAHMLDVSPATVNARLTKARALLRVRLSETPPSTGRETCRPPGPAGDNAHERTGQPDRTSGGCQNGV